MSFTAFRTQCPCSVPNGVDGCQSANSSQRGLRRIGIDNLQKQFWNGQISCFRPADALAKHFAADNGIHARLIPATRLVIRAEMMRIFTCPLLFRYVGATIKTA